MLENCLLINVEVQCKPLSLQCRRSSDSPSHQFWQFCGSVGLYCVILNPQNMLQHVGKLQETPRACAYHLAAEWQLKSSRRMAVKLAANNSLLIQRGSALWLQVLIQKQSLHSSVLGGVSTHHMGLQYCSSSPVLAVDVV